MGLGACGLNFNNASVGFQHAAAFWAELCGCWGRQGSFGPVLGSQAANATEATLEGLGFRENKKRYWDQYGRELSSLNPKLALNLNPGRDCLSPFSKQEPAAHSQAQNQLQILQLGNPRKPRITYVCI